MRGERPRAVAASKFEALGDSRHIGPEF